MNIIIVSHGQFGQGLLDSYEMLRGKSHRIKAVSFDADNSDGFDKRLSLLVDGYLKDNQEVLILSDIANGVPHEKAKNFSEIAPENVQLVGAVNLPMLIEACESADSVLSVSDLATFIQEGRD